MKVRHVCDGQQGLGMGGRGEGGYTLTEHRVWGMCDWNFRWISFHMLILLWNVNCYFQDVCNMTVYLSLQLPHLTYCIIMLVGFLWALQHCIPWISNICSHMGLCKHLKWKICIMSLSYLMPIFLEWRLPITGKVPSVVYNLKLTKNATTWQHIHFVKMLLCSEKCFLTIYIHCYFFFFFYIWNICSWAWEMLTQWHCSAAGHTRPSHCRHGRRWVFLSCNDKVCQVES